MIFLWINRGNNENNSINLKVNKFNKHNDNNLDKNDKYLIGLIEKVLKVYNSKSKFESDSDKLLDIFSLFENKFKEELKKSVFMDFINSIADDEEQLYNNINKIDLLEKLHNNNKSRDIRDHNSNIKMPSSTEMLIEKAFVLSLENKNIIDKSNHISTPLINTEYGIKTIYPIRDLIHN